MNLNLILKCGIAASALSLAVPALAQDTPAPADQAPPAAMPAHDPMPAPTSALPAAQPPQAVYPPCSATVQDQCTNTRREADEKASTRSMPMMRHKHHNRRHN